jgi:hypothetical protein
VPNNTNLKIEREKALKNSKDASLLEPGNIDLAKRPKVRNPDGSYSTVYSHTIPVDERDPNGPAVNIPGVIRTGARPGSYIKVPKGRKGEQMATEAYYKTGEHLGIHKSIADAVKAAELIHDGQQKMYGK